MEQILGYLDQTDAEIVAQGRDAASRLGPCADQASEVAQRALEQLDRDWRLLDWRGEAVADLGHGALGKGEEERARHR